MADAAEVLTLSASGTWDLVFLDFEWGAYVGYWPDLLRALRLGEAQARVAEVVYSMSEPGGALEVTES